MTTSSYRKSTSKQSVYDIITERVLAALETGTAPWHRPWRGSPFGNWPKNLKSKKQYRGANVLMLGMLNPYENPFWLTYKQAQEFGGNVRKGEKSSPAVFWKWYDREDNTTGETKRLPVLRYYAVFNVEQCDGIDSKLPEPEDKRPDLDFTPIDACEEMVSGYENCPEIDHRGARAFYRQSSDEIVMPERVRFDSEPEYYSTLFHELAHSTGHESRLSRKSLTDLDAGFGSDPYAREELVAEMSAAFMCGIAGIENHTLDNSAAYIHGWKTKISANPKLVITAAAQAQKAVDYMREVTFEDATTEETKPELATA